MIGFEKKAVGMLKYTPLLMIEAAKNESMVTRVVENKLMLHVVRFLSSPPPMIRDLNISKLVQVKI